MPSPFEVALSIAAQKQENTERLLKNYVTEQQAPYAAQKAMLENILTQAQGKYQTALATRVPSEIAQNYASANHLNTDASLMPTKYALERWQRMQKDRELNGAQSGYGKAVSDYQTLRDTLGENHPLVKNMRSYLDMQSQPKGGITVIDPQTGNPVVQIGGSSRNTEGGTFIDPKSGKVTTRLTKEQLSKAQNVITAGPQVVEGMKELIAPISNYLGAQGRSKYLADSSINFAFSGKSNPVADYNTAMDNITENAERLLRLNGLNATNESIALMARIMEPKWSDSPYTYERRIEAHIMREKSKIKDAKSNVRQGVDISADIPTSQQVPAPPAPSGLQPMAAMPSLDVIVAERQRRERQRGGAQ